MRCMYLECTNGSFDAWTGLVDVTGAGDWRVKSEDDGVV